MKTILLTGAGGCLAGEIIRQLSNQDQYHILALTSQSKRLHHKFKDVANLTCISVDDWQSKKVKLCDVDFLIHCAFTLKSDATQLASSLAFTKKIFNEAKNYHIPSVINISSKSVYGTLYKPLWKETQPVAPATIYAQAKYDSELLLANTFSQSNTIHYTNLRLSSLIGPEYDIRFIFKFVVSAIEDKCIHIKGGQQTFSFLDIKDAASAIISLISTDHNLWSKVYNVGHYERYSVMEIAQLIKDVAQDDLGIEVNIIVDEKSLSVDVGMDCSLFNHEVSWMPKYMLKDSIKEIFKYYVSTKH